MLIFLRVQHTMLKMLLYIYSFLPYFIDENIASKCYSNSKVVNKCREHEGKCIMWNHFKHGPHFKDTKKSRVLGSECCENAVSPQVSLLDKGEQRQIEKS